MYLMLCTPACALDQSDQSMHCLPKVALGPGSAIIKIMIMKSYLRSFFPFRWFEKDDLTRKSLVGLLVYKKAYWKLQKPFPCQIKALTVLSTGG